MAPTSATKPIRNKIGTRACAAAIFLYLDDSQRNKVWRRIRRIGKKEGPICGERFREKNEFLAALKDWSENADSTNSYLCICAHAGKLGINSKPGVKASRIIWAELAKAIVRPIRYVWLVGCNTNECLNHWNPLRRTVGHLLMATDDEATAALLRFFAREISINNVVFDGEMPELMEKRAPKLAAVTRFFQPKRNGFVRAFLPLTKKN